MLALLIGACVDPPSPPPRNHPNGSTAEWLEWRADDAPVVGPVVVVRDVPGGAIDRLVADPDVTTFFNDRFHPRFERLEIGGGGGTIGFYDGCGCILAAPASPTSPQAVIDTANAVILRPDARACEGRRFSYSCPATSVDDRAGPGPGGL